MIALLHQLANQNGSPISAPVKPASGIAKSHKARLTTHCAELWRNVKQPTTHFFAFPSILFSAHLPNTRSDLDDALKNDERTASMSSEDCRECFPFVLRNSAEELMGLFCEQ